MKGKPKDIQKNCKKKKMSTVLPKDIISLSRDTLVYIFILQISWSLKRRYQILSYVFKSSQTAKVSPKALH